MADAAAVVATPPAAAPVVAAGSTVSSTAPAGTVTAPPVQGAVKADAATPSGLPSLLDPIKPPEAAKEPAKVEQPKPADFSKLEMPKDSLLPATHKEKIAAFASKHSLSPEQAQEVIKQQSADFKEYVDSQVKAYEGVKTGWADALKAHPKYGGERLAETNKGATEVLNRFAPPSLMKALQESGFAYRVDVVEMLDNIYQTMKPDKMVAPGAKTQASTLDNSDQARAKRLFPNSHHV